MVNASDAIAEVNRKSEERFRAVALFSIIKAANSQCFTEETLIKTIEGYIPIKDLKVGDLVLSENEHTGEQGYKKVK